MSYFGLNLVLKPHISCVCVYILQPLFTMQRLKESQDICSISGHENIGVNMWENDSPLSLINVITF